MGNRVQKCGENKKKGRKNIYMHISNNGKERTEIKRYKTNNKSQKSEKCVKERKKITLIFDKIK
jgi:hypothetical protein